ncbi:HD domain-containing protein [Desulfuromonas thiophila]|uniref:HD/PDEase domain-containing protein n=1 Tax=Desulfuromonas thiophila TaxID=57664 RepID=A0A1G6XWQ9_9BACT|nr:HD domain-containing protein [Desulfuromonas thiophila]MDY0397106.1 HD domain-containing protein [Desulfuromonas thiophila]SDD82674.1 hypothetical protein SAMN05661003_101431 [Desulfuromonas thiophila]
MKRVLPAVESVRPDSDGMAELVALLQQQFAAVAGALVPLCDQVAQLYRHGSGRWQPCRAPYHDLGHAVAVSLLALRLLAGWQQLRCQAASAMAVRGLLAAALLHDSGYLLRHSETGRGGQHTFDHVVRGQRLAAHLLAEQGWEREAITLVRQLIGATEFAGARPEVQLAEPFRVLPDLLTSADLLAQVTAPDYPERLTDLYAEFSEAYLAHGRVTLRQQGYFLFDDLTALQRGSAAFVRQRVLPQLAALGLAEPCLRAFYGRADHPYACQLQTNLQRLDALAGR